MGSVYLLRCGSSHLGFRRYNKSYIVGLPTKGMALHVKQGISGVPGAKPGCRSEDWCVLKGTVAHTSQTDDESTVTIGELHIQKRVSCSYAGAPELEERSLEEFMLYPTQKNIGVVYGLEMTLENETEFRLESLIIDPVFDIQSYRESMLP